MTAYSENTNLHNYNVDVFVRYSKTIPDTLVCGRICLKSENPLIESITIEDFQVFSTTTREVAAKAIIALELNALVTPVELKTICADICQNALHDRILAIAPWQDRHQRQIAA